jgi:cytosine/adenosine deaminase-related metal-dependent hydrolase
VPALEVVLHEIAWMGTLTSPSDEWIELFNNTPADINLAGWTLTATDGTPSITLAGTIPAGGHFLLERTDDTTVPGVAADQIYTGALVNDGEVLTLRDDLGVLQDLVDAWYAGVSTTRETMQRVNPQEEGTEPSNWVNGPVEGTPQNSGASGGECGEPLHVTDCQIDPPFVFQEGATVVLNEVMNNPSAVLDSAGEYVELFNAGDTEVDLEGWTLRDDGSDSFTIATGGPVPLAPGEYFVLAVQADPGLNGGFTPDLVWADTYLSNAADEVVLEDDLGVERDRLVYTDAPFTTAAGVSLERVSTRLPTSDTLSWAEAREAMAAGDRGTPGAVNTLQARRYILKGTLVTMDESLPEPDRVFAGAIHVQGNRILDLVPEGDPLPPHAAGAPVLETAGLILPGLLNIHDHLTFNTLPAWDVPGLMEDVSDWTALDDYQTHVRYPRNLLIDSDYYGLHAEVGKYAEVKALAAGTTSVQGAFPLSSGYTGHLARNVELTNFAVDRVRQRSLSVLDSTFQSTEAPALVAAMDAGEVDAWLVHLGEGTGGDAVLEFPVLEDVCLVRSETVIIHGEALTPAELDELAAAGGKIIISPTGNYLYYGATGDVVGAVQRGIPVSLSTDWSPAGDKNLLASLKTLALLNDTMWGGALTDRQMVEMVTTVPAKTLNWCNRLGALRPGLFADLAVLAGDPAAPYASILEATEEDVILTVVDGDPLFGRPALLESLKPGDHEVVSSGCGLQAALDVTDPAVFLGEQTFAEMLGLLEAASAFDFYHMKANFQDPEVAGMTDPEFQAYLDAAFPLGIFPTELDPFWVMDDADYFSYLRSEENVTALDPGATLDIEYLWDTDGDGILNSCEPALLRATSPTGLSLHLVNLGAASIDDLAGTLSDGINYYYRVDERGAPALTLTLEALPAGDTVRIHYN